MTNNTETTLAMPTTEDCLEWLFHKVVSAYDESGPTEQSIMYGAIRNRLIVAQGMAKELKALRLCVTVSLKENIDDVLRQWQQAGGAV